MQAPESWAEAEALQGRRTWRRVLSYWAIAAVVLLWLGFVAYLMLENSSGFAYWIWLKFF
jgi:hypothetical protein